VAAAACTGASGEASRRTPGSFDASSAPTRWPIKHVIFIIKENRSFDNIFGRFPGVDGAHRANDHGKWRPLTRGYDQRTPHDLPHDYQTAIASWDGGLMDGFNVSPPADLYAFTSMRPRQAPNYWSWARNYVLADDFFASAQGPSFPNHMYSIAAQSGGAFENPVQDEHLLRKARLAGYAKAWGCDSVQGAYVPVRDSEHKIVKVPPCFDFKTEGDLLTEKDIPWASYSADRHQVGYMWNAYDAISHIRQNPEVWQKHFFGVDHLVEDIGANRLPPVTWVTPRFALSEHPEYNFCWGENWTTTIVNAVMRSDMWKDTAIFVTWDDWGGFYDHVPPPQVDDMGFGIRVPLLLISPYAKQGYVWHSPGEFSTVLRFIEDNWGLSQLTHRDREAASLADAFDFTQAPRAPEPLPLRRDCVGSVFKPPPPEAYA
jgi:phospholipase C